MSVVRDFILIVVRLKHCSESSQIFYLSCSEVKQCIERSQRFYFNSCESGTAL